MYIRFEAYTCKICRFCMALFQLPTRRLICFDFVSIILFFFSDHLTKNGYIRSSMGLMHPMVLTLGWFRYKQGTMLNITGTVYIKRQQALSYFLALVHCTEVHFASFCSSGSITVIVVHPPERKLPKHTSVQCTKAKE